MNTHIKTVSNIYDAFGKGDIPTILEQLSDDVNWESWEYNTAQKKGVPWLQPRKGKNNVMEFFKIIGEMDFKEFNVKSLMQGENQVAAEVVLEAEIPSSGEVLRDEEIHLWTFNDAGKVIRMRHYTDTAKHVQVARLEAVS